MTSPVPTSDFPAASRPTLSETDRLASPAASPRPASQTDRFAAAFAVVLGHEGGYTADPTDPGNWTGGAPGRGECRGTNWGISAASYPDLPIRALTPDQARTIYRRDYWDRVRGDRLPAPLALLVFDAAVNCGVGRAARWLQGVLGVAQDGVVGEVTLAALARRIGRRTEGLAVPGETRATRSGSFSDGGTLQICSDFQAARLLYMTSLPTWKRFGGGWAKRLCRLPFEAIRMEMP